MFVLYLCRMSPSPMQVRFQTTKSKPPSRLTGTVYNYKLLLPFISIECNLKKPIQKLLYRHRELNPGLRDNPEGWDGWMWSFKPALSVSSFTFNKKLFSSLSLSEIWLVSSAYLKLLVLFLATLIPASASSSPAFHMMHSAYKLNKLGYNIQPWHTPFLI